MNSEWLSFLSRSGARTDDGVVSDFGNPADELQALAAAPVMADVSALGILVFSGEDAGNFLQGQLSCDVLKLGLNDSAYGSYCSPKGRALASFLIRRTGEGYVMALPREVLPAIQKRLSMFVLRSKVKVQDASDQLVLIGLADPRGETALAALVGSVPAAEHHGKGVAGGLLSRMSATRWLWCGDVAAAISAWALFAGGFKAVGAANWSWLEICAGVPWVTVPTQDQFVPQMINLELIGGVSFQKGCYTGQEIVARTQYLGKLKRRMYLANVPVAAVPAPGAALYSEDLGDQASGMVVNAQASPNGGVDMLVVAQVASVDASVVHLASLDGPALHFHALPYALP
jgi:folate-binding protein YgfZ